jgi:hypothetical protein
MVVRWPSTPAWWKKALGRREKGLSRRYNAVARRKKTHVRWQKAIALGRKE